MTSLSKSGAVGPVSSFETQSDVVMNKLKTVKRHNTELMTPNLNIRKIVFNKEEDHNPLNLRLDEIQRCISKASELTLPQNKAINESRNSRNRNQTMFDFETLTVPELISPAGPSQDSNDIISVKTVTPYLEEEEQMKT